MILAELLLAFRRTIADADAEGGAAGVTADEGFGEDDQLRPVRSRLGQQPLRLIQSGGRVVEDGGGLDDGGADDGGGGGGVGGHVDLGDEGEGLAVVDGIGWNQRHCYSVYLSLSVWLGFCCRSEPELSFVAVWSESREQRDVWKLVCLS